MNRPTGAIGVARRALSLDRVSAGWRAYVLLALITLLAALPGVFGLPAMDRDESRFAQASKQMLETGDFITIREQDGLRNKKPAGIHWLQAGATAAFSSAQAKDIWSYRLPSLLGAMVAAALTFWAGWPLVGRKAALLGSALFASTLLLTTEAHLAKTDAILCAFTVLGMGALVRLWQVEGPKDRRSWALLFWAAMGAGFLIKGPVTPMVAFLCVGALVLWERRALWTRPLAGWAGPLLFVAMVLPWFIWVQIATDGAFLEGAVGKDLRDKIVGASEGHGGPPGFHLAHLPTHFFPATLLLIPAIVLTVRALRGKGTDAAMRSSGLRFLVSWALPTWLVFEILPTKLSHYVLPAYPAMALLCGWAAMRLIEGVRAPVSRAVSALVFAVGTAFLAFIAAPSGTRILKAEPASDFTQMTPEAVLAAWAPALSIPLTVLVVGTTLAIIALALAFTRRTAAMIGLAVAASVLIGGHIRGAFLPAQVWAQPTVTARAALAEVCALPDRDDLPAACADTPLPERVRAVGYAEPSLPFTTGTNTTIPPNTVLSVQDGNRVEPVTAFVVNLEDEIGPATLESLRAEARALGRCVTESTLHPALNYSNGDPVVFVALRIADCPQ
jgi:4-amino-4-deoxy-L-arabinose transferase-like glycosyltransferase